MQRSDIHDNSKPLLAQELTNKLQKKEHHEQAVPQGQSTKHGSFALQQNKLWWVESRRPYESPHKFKELKRFEWHILCINNNTFYLKDRKSQKIPVMATKAGTPPLPQKKIKKNIK